MGTEKINDVQILLKDLFGVCAEQLNNRGDIHRRLNKVSRDIDIESFVQFKETATFKKIEAIFGQPQVFHYGILVYDNYDLDSYNTLIPFKSVIAKGKTRDDAVKGINQKLGLSQSNARDFLINEKNDQIVRSLGHDGYIMFSHDMKEASDKWSIELYQIEISNANISHNLFTETYKFDKLDELWKERNSVLTIFCEDIMKYNGFGSGVMYTGMKVIDVDIQGRSSAYLMVNTDSVDMLKSFMADSLIQYRIAFLTSSVRSLYTKIHSDLQRYESIKSAVAAIMSRNMSHNLGSHFISNTKNYFSALIDRGGDEEANYRGVRHALQYIQERMDFIATITSTDIYPYGAVNAKAQFFDELTPDEFGKRHDEKSYNFLLDYLVLSENISKRSWLGDKAVLSGGKYKMKLQIGQWDGSGIPDYWNSEILDSEEENKKRDKLLEINFAIPGGILGRHALLSIVENVMRNAAKHGWGNNQVQNDFVIRMLYRTDEQRLIIFDNKEDESIKDTVGGLKNRLKNSHFIKDGQLDQDNKGLKEMLICASWLQNENVAQVMTDNDMENDLDRKLSNIEKYLKVVAVNKDGIEIDFNKESIGFLGYSINLNKYERVHFLKKEEIEGDLNNIRADVVCYPEDSQINGKKLSEIFPRFLVISPKEYEGLNDNEILKRVVNQNCGSSAIGKTMVVSYNTDYAEDSNVVPYSKWNADGNPFLFKTHAAKSKWDKFSSLFLTKGFDDDQYVDAISGGDFTSTLVQPSFVKDEYNLLKIKESVATQFVIIDERIFEHYKTNVILTKALNNRIKLGLENLRNEFKNEQLFEEIAYYVFKEKSVLESGIYDSHKEELISFVSNTKLFSRFIDKDIEQHFLDRRGIHVFNIEPDEKGFQLFDLSSTEYSFYYDKNKFCNDVDNSIAPFSENNNEMIFLSVHLGVIDKIRERLLKNDKSIDEKKVDKEIVDSLQRFFGAKFVLIHTGRGGLDIRQSLREYPIRSFSSIENPLYNSKFLLSQQFYNIKYHGAESF